MREEEDISLYFEHSPNTSLKIAYFMATYHIVLIDIFCAKSPYGVCLFAMFLDLRMVHCHPRYGSLRTYSGDQKWKKSVFSIIDYSKEEMTI
jgi:hypothetical protein